MPRVRPSRHERQALREAGEWVPIPSNTAISPEEAFLSFEDDTIPQPGAFEPTVSLNPEDFFSLNYESGSVFGSFSGELSDHLGDRFQPGDILPDFPTFGGKELSDLILSTACAAVCARVHVHENLDGWCNRSEELQTSLPNPLADFVSCRGSSTDPDGVSWTMSHPSSFAKAAVRSARYISRGDYQSARENFWLPVGPDDPRTKAIVAQRLVDVLGAEGVSIQPSVAEEFVFSGLRAPWQDHPSLSFTGFQSSVSVCQQTAALFMRSCETGAGRRVLRHLSLTWHRPNVDDLLIADPMVYTKEKLTTWNTLLPSIQRATGLTCSIVNYLAPGSPTQASVTLPHSEGVEIILPRRGACPRIEHEVLFSEHSSFNKSAGYRVLGCSLTYHHLARRMAESIL